MKGISKRATSLIRRQFTALAMSVSESNNIGIASKQLAIKRTAEKILDYAIDPKTAKGIIEVIFAESKFKTIDDVYRQTPLIISFRNFVDGNVESNTLLVKHVLVVNTDLETLSLFKATITNDPMLLLLYSKSKID